MFDPLTVLKTLPKKDHWRTSEVAEAFGLITASIKRVAYKYKIGRIYGRKLTGVRIFEPDDIFDLCKYLRGPGTRGRYGKQEWQVQSDFVERQRKKWKKGKRR